jgi:hypothetical protein
MTTCWMCNRTINTNRVIDLDDAGWGYGICNHILCPTHYKRDQKEMKERLKVYEKERKQAKFNDQGAVI